MGKKIIKIVYTLEFVGVGLNWVELTVLEEGTSLHIRKTFDKVFLCRYPRPVMVIHNN